MPIETFTIRTKWDACSRYTLNVIHFPIPAQITGRIIHLQHPINGRISSIPHSVADSCRSLQMWFLPELGPGLVPSAKMVEVIWPGTAILPVVLRPTRCSLKAVEEDEGNVKRGQGGDQDGARACTQSADDGKWPSTVGAIWKYAFVFLDLQVSWVWLSVAEQLCFWLRELERPYPHVLHPSWLTTTRACSFQGKGQYTRGQV